MDILLKSGIFGSLSVVFFVLILLTGILVVAITRSRRATTTFMVLAFIPLLLGLCGTFAGYWVAEQSKREYGPAMSSEDMNHPESVIQVGRQEARLSTYLGAGATVVLLIVFGCGLALTKNVEK